MAECPVCESVLKKAEKQGERFFYECPRCGPYSLSLEANQDLAWWLERTENGRTVLSYAIYRMTKGRSDWPILTTEQLENTLKNTALPLPKEQLDNFILWLGETQSSPSEAISITSQSIAASGALDINGVGFVVEYAERRGLVDANVQRLSDGQYSLGLCQLTFPGWEYFYDLQRGYSSSRIAVMAMEFGHQALDAIVRDHFRPAVAATGFDLKRIDEGQPAGLIDDRMRVEIRQSRFLISDLSHENRGAYWEAGYAEGLGKPVIYTCRKDVHEKEGTHFDTNHHLTVVWDPENIGEALEKLKATIRATLPEEAKLNDE